MPVQLQIDGGERYLPYAKKRLALLQEQLLRQGLRTGTRRYKLDDAEIEVHVSVPVDVGSGKPRPERAQNRIRIERGQKVRGAFLRFFNTTLGHGTFRTIKLGAEGEDVFTTDGVTRLGAKLRLSGFRVYDPSAALPLEARTLITKSAYGPIQSALALGPSSDPDVVAIGEHLVGNYQQISAQLFDGRIALLAYLHAVSIDSGQSPQAAVAAIHPDDWKLIYEGTDMEYRVSIPPGTDGVEIAFGSYAYFFTPSLTRVPGTYEIDQTISDAPQAGLLPFSAITQLRLSRITGKLEVGGDGEIAGTVVPHFLYSTEFFTAEAKTRRASKSKLVTLDELLGPQVIEKEPDPHVIGGVRVFHQITRHVSTDLVSGPAAGLVVTYFEYDLLRLEDDEAFLVLTDVRGYKVGLSDPALAGSGFSVTPLDVYEVKRFDFERTVVDEISVHLSTTLNVHARTRSISLPNGRAEMLATSGYTRTTDFFYHSPFYDGTFPVVTYQGRSYEISRDKSFALYGDGLLVAADEPAGRKWYLYGEQMPNDPPITDFELANELGNDWHNEVLDAFQQYEADLEDFFETYTLVSNPGHPAGYAVSQARQVAVDAEFIRAKAIPFVRHSGIFVNSRAIAIIWAHATTTKVGVCILQTRDDPGSVGWADFHSALNIALHAKRAGEPYQTLLDQALDMVSYKLNNFASWELVSKFDQPGTYYIAT
ncbi:MAG: hypothetical protein ACREXW_00930 [Gammaproteobacteria bacterium]